MNVILFQFFKLDLIRLLDFLLIHIDHICIQSSVNLSNTYTLCLLV